MHGSPCITERLFDLDFKVSPQAFFQVNTPSAEVLYKTVGDLANLKPDESTLIDVCCGTGTIGLCLANRCKKVFGVDIVEEAIKDARINAERNNVHNTSWVAGKFGRSF